MAAVSAVVALKNTPTEIVDKLNKAIRHEKTNLKLAFVTALRSMVSPATARGKSRSGF
jgi:hypothetical protein